MYLDAGNDCKDTPVPDPHHFKIVDVDDPDFVSATDQLDVGNIVDSLFAATLWDQSESD